MQLFKVGVGGMHYVEVRETEPQIFSSTYVKKTITIELEEERQKRWSGDPCCFFRV